MTEAKLIFKGVVMSKEIKSFEKTSMWLAIAVDSHKQIMPHERQIIQPKINNAKTVQELIAIADEYYPWGYKAFSKKWMD